MFRRPRAPWEGLDDEDRECLEALIRDDYARIHPGDTLEDLKRRAHFSRADLGLLRDWLDVARRRAASQPRVGVSRRKAAAA